MKHVNYLMVCMLFQSFFTVLSEDISSILQEAYRGDKEAIRQRLENGENCAIKDANGNTVFHIAAKQGHKEIVSMISEYYDNCGWWSYYISGPTLPNLDDINNDGDTPLHSVIGASSEHEDKTKHIEIADYLSHKKPKLAEIFNKNNYSPVFFAAKKDDPRFIRVLAHALNFHEHKRNGDTLIHYSIKEEKPKTAHYCITETTLISDENEEGKTPMLLSIDKDDISILELLRLQGVHLNTSTKKGFYPILYATSCNKYKSVNYLLNNNISVETADDEGNTLLFHANNEEMFEFLLSRNADIRKKNKRDEDVFVHGVRTKKYAIIPYLAQQPSIDINVRSSNGQTEMIRAAVNQDIRMLEVLTNIGADSNIVDNDKENVLHKLAKNGNRKGGEIILNQNKSLMYGMNSYGNTPLFSAVIYDQLVFAEWLVDCNVPLNHVNNHGDTIVHEVAKKKAPQFFTKILNKVDSAFIHSKNNDGETPLFEAVRNDNGIAVKELIQRKADYLNIKNNTGCTLMQLASTADAVEAMRELKAQGSSFVHCSSEGDTLVHFAARHGASKIIRYLQSMREPFHLRNKNGETPLMCAVKKGQLEATKLLLQENDYINGDVYRLIKTTENTRNAAYAFIVQQHNDRVHAAQKIFNIKAEIENLISHNQQLLITLFQQNPSYKIGYFSYIPSSPKSSSVDTIYNMTEQERMQLFNHYVDCKNNELNFKMIVDQELSKIRIEREREKREQERQRIAQEQERVRNEQERQRLIAHENKIKDCNRVYVKQTTVNGFIAENRELLKNRMNSFSYQQSQCATMAQLPSEEKLYDFNPITLEQWEKTIDQCIKEEFTLNKILKSQSSTTPSTSDGITFIKKEEVDEYFLRNLRKLEVQIKKEIEKSDTTQSSKQEKQDILKKIINRIKTEGKREINNLSNDFSLDADQKIVNEWTSIENLRIKIVTQMKKEIR